VGDLLHEIVECLIAHVGIELRRLDHQQRCRVVMKEEVMIRLVQFPEIFFVGFECVTLRL
jgi:hypothetical protein